MAIDLTSLIARFRPRDDREGAFAVFRTRTPWVAPYAYFNILFRPAPEQLLADMTRELDFPTSVEELLRVHNGAILLGGNVALYGVVAARQLVNRSDPFGRLPFSIASENDAWPSTPDRLLVIGGYELDGSRVVIDRRDGTVSARRKSESRVVCSRPSLGAWLTGELARIGSLFDEEGRLVGTDVRAPRDLIRKGDWNRFVISARGKELSLEINGKPAWKHAGIEAADGFIGIQSEVPAGGEFEFRNVKVTEQGYASIFNGKDLSGWRGATGGYSVENGSLVCRKEGGGNLYAEREYADFAVRFDFKLEPGGNNGLGIRAPIKGDAVDGDAVMEIHVAGHCPDAGASTGLLIDSHDAAVAAPVWALLERLTARIGPRPTLVERDGNLPPFDEVIVERRQAQSVIDAAARVRREVLA